MEGLRRPSRSLRREPVLLQRTVTTHSGRDSWFRVVSPETAASTSEGNKGLSRHLIRISAAAHGLVRTPRPGLGHTASMKTTVVSPVKAVALVALGLAIAGMGIHV